MTAASNRLLASKFQRAAGTATQVLAPAIPSPAADARPRRSKFTVNLSAHDAEDFDALVLTARRTLGRRVDKSELIRAAITLLGRDAALRHEIFEVIREQELNRNKEGARESLHP